MHFFTSDLHLGHANIIKYCNRPFSDVQEMDRELITRWNYLVGPNDTVFILGDFTLGDSDAAHRYFNQLNGWILALTYPWHHDRRWLPIDNRASPYCSKDLKFVRDRPPMYIVEYNELSVDGDRPLPIVLCHYPIHTWDRKHYGAWHLYGHVHNRDAEPPGGRCMNVGVDVNGFCPVSLEQVIAYMRRFDDE